MKYLQILSFALLLTSCSSGELITVFRDSQLDNMYFHDESVIICPSTGKWNFFGKDSSFFAIPEAKLYTEAFSTKLNELRPCLNVVDQSQLNLGFPGLEIAMSRRKYCYNNMTEEDSTFFKYLENAFNAQYFIFFESMEFFAKEGRTQQGVQFTNKESKLILQLWDLKKKKMVYRTLSKGNGTDVMSLMKEQSSNEALENSFVEFIESLPKCIQKY